MRDEQADDFRHRHEVQLRFKDDAERSFAADEQLMQADGDFRRIGFQSRGITGMIGIVPHEGIGEYVQVVAADAP